MSESKNNYRINPKKKKERKNIINYIYKKVFLIYNIKQTKYNINYHNIYICH